MKKVLFLFVISIAIASCKNSEEKKTEDTSNMTSYTGEFIYLDDAAVLKGDTFIYGVTMDDMAAELADKVAPVKSDEFDMVEVVVKGVVNPKPDGTDGWEEIITIKEIVSVSDKPSPADIKFEQTEEEEPEEETKA